MNTALVSSLSLTSAFMVYGPEPSSSQPSRSLSLGYWSGLTMPETGVDSLYGKVASAVLRWKTTSRSPWVSTVSTVLSSEATSVSASMASARSMEYLTSSAVTGSPLANFSPSRRVHAYRSFPVSVNPHFCAASGTGSPPPRGCAMSVCVV